VRLGFAVKVLGEGGLSSHDSRRWQAGPHLRVSLERLRQVFAYLERVGIDMYRFSPNLAPYATHPDMPQFRGQVEESREEVAEAGLIARRQGLRLSCHPSQYIVLNSEDETVQSSAVADLELQVSIFDAMGLPPESVVILHVGGIAGGREAARERFLRGFELLSDPARARLAIENDDRTFNAVDVASLAREAGIPMIWDVLHHHCNDPHGVPDREALEMALATWPAGVLPKIHYSSPKTAMEEKVVRRGRRVERSRVLPQLRAHADLVDPIGFEHFVTEIARGLDFDVMLEAKGKDLALLRLREQLDARGVNLPGAASQTGSAEPRAVDDA
jgi:UV DNA damage endonuclease